MKIGEIMAADREITLNEGKKTVTVTVANKGDRPVQVGSHFHFFEVNKCLSFDREKAYGYHLDIPSGTSVRFEPGEEKEVQLTEMGGRQRVFGLNDLTRAQATDDTLPHICFRKFLYSLLSLLTEILLISQFPWMLLLYRQLPAHG